MSKVIRLERRDPQRRRELQEAAERKKIRSDAIFFAVLFSGVALLMYSLMVLMLPTSSSEKLWLAWLIFAIAVSKLLVANGLFFGILAHDAHAQTQRKPRGPTRALPRLTAMLPALPELRPRPKVRVIRGANPRPRINRPRPERPGP